MAFLLLLAAQSAGAYPPIDDQESVPYGLIVVDRQGCGAYPPVGEITVEGARLPDNPGVMDRFYVHAYQFATDSTLVVVDMPEIWYYQDAEVYRRLLHYNRPMMNSIVRTALGRALTEEILDQDTDDEGMRRWLRAPAGSHEAFVQDLRQGFDAQFSLHLAGDLRTTLWYRTGSISLAADHSTRQGRVSNLRVSYPFYSSSYRGEIGVTTDGNVWLQFLGRW